MLVEAHVDRELLEVVVRDRRASRPPLVLAPLQQGGNADVDGVVLRAHEVVTTVPLDEAGKDQLALEQSEPLRDDLLGLQECVGHRCNSSFRNPVVEPQQPPMADVRCLVAAGDALGQLGGVVFLR
jgi:hypothetical protein